MATTEPDDEDGSLSETDYVKFLCAPAVGRFNRWRPSTSANDAAEMVACPSVRDGLPFEPIAHSVRARKFRLNAYASRRNS